MKIASGLILVLSWHLAGAQEAKQYMLMWEDVEGAADGQAASPTAYLKKVCENINKEGQEREGKKKKCVSHGNPDDGGLPYMLLDITKEEYHNMGEWCPRCIVDVFEDSDIGEWCPTMRPEVHSFDEIDQSDWLENITTVWNLDRIDQRLGLDKMYKPEGEGEGVNVYVFDTGIRTTHKEFEGRAWPYIEVLDGTVKDCNKTELKCASDLNGHGTHVAGTIGGKTYGVAKKATLMAVKVLSQRRGNLCNVIPAMDWIMQHNIKNKRAIMSMSLGSDDGAKFMNFAVEKAVKSGFVVTVAAGNVGNSGTRDGQACSVTPASAKHAVTVGGTARNDARARWSNAGKCVDIWAPGERIMSASHRSDETAQVMTGTSMATPAVAGAAALLWGRYMAWTNMDVTKKLGEMATQNVVKMTPASSSKFLYVGPEKAPQPTPLPGIPAPTPPPPSNRRRFERRRRSAPSPTTTTTTPWREPPTDSPTQPCCLSLKQRLIALENEYQKLRWLPPVVQDLQERVKKLEMGSGPSPGRRRRRRIVKPTRPPIQPTPAPTPRPRPTRPPFTRRRRFVVPRRRRSPVVDRRRRRTPPVKTTTTTTSYHREFRPE